MCESRSQNEQMQLDLPKASCFGRVLCKKYEIQRENLPKLKLRPMVEATGFCSIHVSASMHVGQVHRFLDTTLCLCCPTVLQHADSRFISPACIRLDPINTALSRQQS